MWREEMAEMTRRFRSIRRAVAAQSPGLGFIAAQNGMFSNLELTGEQVALLREDRAFYMVVSRRITWPGRAMATSSGSVRRSRCFCPSPEPGCTACHWCISDRCRRPR